MGGKRRQRRRSRTGFAAAAVAAALSLSLSACGGGDSSSDADATTGTYRVEVVSAEFPTKQRLGETTLLQLGVRNTGRKTMPALTVTVSLGSDEGRDSALPFGFRDPQPELAQPDRPVWALSAGYPKIDGSSGPGGAETANLKTFDFGPLKPGARIDAVWKLSAVKTGDFELFYEIGAGLSGTAKAETAQGADAGGSFATRITEAPPDSVVTDSGEVVPAPEDPTEANR